MTSLFGGTRQQISGPTGAFVAVLAIITAQHGIAGLQIATLMAGMILLAFGVARLGAVIKYIPNPVIAGFTAGIGVIIFVGQWKDFFGLSPAPAGPRFHEKLLSLLEAWSTINPATTGLGLMALAILLLGARFLKRIPAPLVALVVVTVVQAIGQFKGVATIGSASFTSLLFVSTRDVHPGDFSDRPRVHHCAAWRHRVVTVGCGIRRHDGDPARLESGTHRPGNCQYRCTALRRVRGHRCDCAHGNQYS
jgi:MFS superfamily sulfate permease-like transporter